MLMIASRQGDGPAAAVEAIRRVRPDLGGRDERGARRPVSAGRVFLLPADLGRARDDHDVLRPPSYNGAAFGVDQPAPRRDCGTARAWFLAEADGQRRPVALGASRRSRRACRASSWPRAFDLARSASSDDAGDSGEFALLRVRAARIDRVCRAAGSDDGRGGRVSDVDRRAAADFVDAEEPR